jgi:hypothetical protein
MTLLSLSIYVVFVDPHLGNNDVMPFSLPTTKAYVEFIGREKARAYLQCIYYKSQTTDPKGVESYKQIKMCMCMDIYGG